MSKMEKKEYFVAVRLNHLVVEDQEHQRIKENWPGQWFPKYCHRDPKLCCDAVVANVWSEETPEEMTDRLIKLLGDGVRMVDLYPLFHSFDGPADQDRQEEQFEEVSHG